MGKEKRPNNGHNTTAKERHRKTAKDIDYSAPLPQGLVARKEVPKSKHQSYFEIVENKDYKKKTLELERTTNREPPQLFTFVPLGNPELTTRCKDVSRESDAMVYIVSTPNGVKTDLSQQMNRVGHHFRENIVTEALQALGLQEMHRPVLTQDGVEVIPDTQQEISEQADAAIRELFPRIPHTDRGEIVDHAFRKGKFVKPGEPVVGLQSGLPLSRRVQLAVLAHIRHRHTRYDSLLRETTWANARRVTEDVCLDYLVKWRGDDENGREQDDEILREVVVLSDDSGDEGSDSDAETDMSEDVVIQSDNAVGTDLASRAVAVEANKDSRQKQTQPKAARKKVQGQQRASKVQKRQRRKEARSYKRYEAAWERAVQRQQAADHGHRASPLAPPGADRFMTGRSPMREYPGSPTPNQQQQQPRPPPVVYTDQPPRPSDVAPVYIPITSSPLRPIPVDGYGQPRRYSGAVRSPRHSPIHSPMRPYPSAHRKVNSIGRGSVAHGVTSPQARSPHSFPIQDMLHPSIEPGSPSGHRNGPGAPTHHLQESHLVPQPSVAQDVQDSPEVIVIREGRCPPVQEQGQVMGRESPSRRAYEPRRMLYPQPDERHGPPSSYHQPSGQRPVVIPSYLANSEYSRVDHRPSQREAPLHDARSPSGFVQHGYNGHSPAETSRPRYEADARNGGIPRPAREAEMFTSDRPADPAREGFFRLREHVSALPPSAVGHDEGFVRLREPAVIRAQPRVELSSSVPRRDPAGPSPFDSPDNRLWDRSAPTYPMETSPYRHQPGPAHHYQPMPYGEAVAYRAAPVHEPRREYEQQPPHDYRDERRLRPRTPRHGEREVIVLDS